MTDINYIFLKVLAIVAIGYVLKQTKVLTIEHGKFLSRIVLNITLPAVILKTISTIKLDYSLFLAPLISLFHSVVVAVAAIFLFKKESAQNKGVALMSSVGFNIGLFAYPVILDLFGSSGLSIIAMVDFGNAFIVFGLSYFLGYIYSKKRSGEKLSIAGIIKLFATSVPFMCYLVAAAMNVCNVRFSGLPLEIIDSIAQANTAMAFIVLGLTLDFRFESSHWKLIGKVLGLRYIAGLTSGIILFMILPFPYVYRIVTLIGLILPVAMAIIPYSVEFEYDTRITATIANCMMIISFLLMWLLMMIIKPG
ncbi:MAG: AEC family transporter [Chitinispirillaceae bacterium]|nr:AEC family transporter [Chitinispirillaceae bacterium]